MDIYFYYYSFRYGHRSTVTINLVLPLLDLLNTQNIITSRLDDNWTLFVVNLGKRCVEKVVWWAIKPENKSFSISLFLSAPEMMISLQINLNQSS